ncbi:branched-chain amino acid ABC transporter permease [Acidisphaera sp. L21]|uniref:branched-chain amino acid ABC transporter permease n=1 Tax=Acidisphaera sp. L21 TaxID=1641851 RepID=UPI00131BC7DB|nr:branched-chain amino acid ABC transporter permease [Acidisphaera sp. L21]
MENYLVALGVTAGLYALMAIGLNVIWGMAGLVNLGLVGFFAVGAYTSALLTTKLGVAIGVGMVAGAVAGGVAGALVALITARLRGDYLAIVTLGFAESLRTTASNETWLTNGTDGISGIPGPWRSVLTPSEFNLAYLALVVVIVLIAYLLAQRLSYSPFGRVLRAIRDDEQVAAVAGKPVLAFKVLAFAIGCTALGLAGALYAHYTSFVVPDIFVPLLTLYIKMALLSGGVGNNRGAVLGGLVVVIFLEGTRFITPYIPWLGAVQAAALQQFLVTAALLVVLRFRTRGLVPEPPDHPILRRT